MRITALMENTTSRKDMLVEHGLSLYIETDSLRVLFDMGQSDGFLANAARLGIDLSTVDIAVLSHGHYDHGDGLPAFLAVNDRAPVYVSRHAFGDYYNASGKYIGLTQALRTHPRLTLTDGTMTLAEGITLFSCHGMPCPFPPKNLGLTEKVGDAYIPDLFIHEQYLLIEEHGRRVLFSGCAHRGVLNIATHFQPDVLVGGFHFSKLGTDDTLRSYADYLDTLHTAFYTCHCTGDAQYRFMKETMRRLHFLSCGETVSLP
ncbi:MAG: MBL fold metallo-hydrolase [Clostridia bacterium]|nr:MBL fold metallo-hydrolase [Clostridia bacterium]